MLVTSPALTFQALLLFVPKESREKLLPPCRRFNRRRVFCVFFPAEVVQATQRAVEAGGGPSG